MIISNAHNFLFIAVPKTGTTYIENHFVKHINDAKLINNSQSGPSVTELHKHSDIIDMHELGIFKLHQSKFKVAFVRNPYDRIVSWFCCYAQRRNAKKAQVKHANFYGTKYLSGSFVDFVKHAPPFIFKNSISFMLDEFGRKQVDFIAKFENFTKDLNYICDRINIPNIKPIADKVNASEHTAYASYYNEETREIVAKQYAKDIEYFNYKFGG